MIKIAVVGGRDFTDKAGLTRYLDGFIDRYRDEGNVTIVSGGAKGADTLAKQYAKEHRLACIEYLPDWDRYGKSAGFKRNKQIVKGCDYLIAFWDGDSKGTKLSIDLAKAAEKRTHIVYY